MTEQKSKEENGYEEFNNFSELLDGIKQYNPNADKDMILKACKVAYESHRGQKRASGEPYFVHCYEVAKILAALRMDSHTIMAGLLHDAVEDTSVSVDHIRKEFDTETADIVESVTKLEYSPVDTFESDEEGKRAENIRKVILATSKDVRVIIVKLADRLHNMRTLKHLPEAKRVVIAQETMNIYAPIAQKLGINSMKAELEDLSFRFLDNKSYTEFKNKINKKREQRESEVNEIIEDVKKRLHTGGVEAEVQGRAKHFYSIFKKITNKNKEFNEIYDLIAIRIITKTIKDCYTALGIVHERWKPMPGKFKDYIAVPRSNGYQSLHTTVMGRHGRILEVQIRTEDMHLAAEQGIAAHWRYKGTDSDKKFDKQIEWLKQILDWRLHSSDAKEFIENMKVDLFEREIFVFTPKGDPISLPEGATPVDFAYAVHTDIGKHCSKAKVNGNIVTLDTPLKSGDIVEVITQKNAKPSRSWLSFVKSASARSKIKSQLNIKVNQDSKRLREEEEERRKDGIDLSDMNINVNGKKYPVKISRCCNPKTTDDIVGFRTKDGKVAVHKKGCENILLYDESKKVDISLHNIKPETVNLVIILKDRIGAIARVLTKLSEEHHNILEVNTKPSRSNQIMMRLELEKADKDIDSILSKVKSLDVVVSAQKEV
ncbi:MAG: RelA/SpoT family protein [Candidatus Woesearchaeota archaeon]